MILISLRKLNFKMSSILDLSEIQFWRLADKDHVLSGMSPKALESRLRDDIRGRLVGAC